MPPETLTEIEPPSLSGLYLYLTDRCNLRCSHCWIAPSFSEQKQTGTPFEPLKKTIKKAKTMGLCNVKLTGGEPLLYESIYDLLAFLTEEQLTITIETNGTLIGPEIITALQSCRIRQVAVSLDGADENTHDTIRGQKGCYQETLKGLKLLAKSGINSQVIMTIQKKNRNEIPKMIALCENLGIHTMKINHLIPCGRANQAFDKGDNLTLEELTALYNKVKVEWETPEKMKVFFDLPVVFQSIADITACGVHECPILNILGILGNGDFSICGIGQTIKALRIGNIVTDDIARIWQESEVLKDLRSSLPQELKGVCRNCIFKFQCLGNCRANAYAVSGDLFAPYFLCQQLHEKDKFPTSRCINI